MGMFSVDQFLNATISEANDTTIKPCPPGEFNATIEKIEPKAGTITKGDRVGQDWARLDVFWRVDDPAVAQLLGREKVSVKQGIMLDLTPTGGLDMGEGKNINLGRLREAVGQNQKGQPWQPLMLMGRSAKIRVGHRPDERDNQTIYAEVQGVARQS